MGTFASLDAYENTIEHVSKMMLQKLSINIYMHIIAPPSGNVISILSRRHFIFQDTI